MSNCRKMQQGCQVGVVRCGGMTELAEEVDGSMHVLREWMGSGVRVGGFGTGVLGEMVCVVRVGWWEGSRSF